MWGQRPQVGLGAGAEQGVGEVEMVQGQGRAGEWREKCVLTISLLAVHL